MRQVVEVNSGAGKHPDPDHQDEVQNNVEEVEDHPGQSRVARHLQGLHGRHLLHDQEGRIGQDEGMAGDVVAVPVEASLPADAFHGEFLLHHFHRVGFVARTRHVLDVEEGPGADVPNGRCHHQRQQPAAEEGRVSAERRVGQEDEGCEQQQGPTPGQFDEVPAGVSTEPLVNFIYPALHGENLHTHSFTIFIYIDIYIIPELLGYLA